MPRHCTICANPKTAQITKDIVAGHSFRTVASRYGLTPASVQRHSRNCLKVVRRGSTGRDKDEDASNGDSVRFDLVDDRCQSCGMLQSAPDPQSMMKRAERALYIAEGTVIRAGKRGDDNLLLKALDRVRLSLELLMKSLDMISAQSAVDNRRFTNIFAGRSVEELRTIVSALAAQGAASPYLQAEGQTALRGRDEEIT
jgi:hypothetical protein